MEPARQPWFRQPKNIQPFGLFTFLTSSDSKTTYHSHSCFPWTSQSLETFWGGHARDNPHLVSQWKDVTQRWTGTIAVGGTGSLYIFPKLAAGKPIVTRLSKPEMEVHNVAWALNHNNHLRPLLVLTLGSVVVIYDVTTHEVVGKLWGHGGHITSIEVHPTQPNLFCTTSQDFTSRIYDLSLRPVQEPNNPHWLPDRLPSLAGPAHGLHMSGPEGEGIGQCVAVMVGGRSGGHKASVSCCAFHPSEPLIATGGVDRAVKIWRIPPSVFDPPGLPILAREDKPLFSTNMLHKARVLSINWLSDDILVSSSAPALMRRSPEDPEDTYWEDGTVAVWQWLGLNRFFPPGKIPQKVMRGTASDWRNSVSFKILSAYHLPQAVNSIHVYRSPSHDPILLMPVGTVIRVFNISEFAPATPPVFPIDRQDLLNPTAVREGNQVSVSDDERGGGEHEGQGQSINRTITYLPPAPLRLLVDTVGGWEAVAGLPNGRGPANMPDIIACSVACEGQGIVGIGQNDALYIWKVNR